jgi:hypothetical protein
LIDIRRGQRVESSHPGVARLYAHASDTDQALRWLEHAYDARETTLIHLGVGWDWNALRSDLRFVHLLTRMNLPT